jgi:hypothetical protein
VLMSQFQENAFVCCMHIAHRANLFGMMVVLEKFKALADLK